MLEDITSRLPDNLNEMIKEMDMSLQAGFITGSLSYMSGVLYVYRQKVSGLPIIHRLPGKVAGSLVGLTLAAVGMGTALSFYKLVQKPIEEKKLDCSNCALTRGAGACAGFTGAGMLSVTSIYAHHFQPKNGLANLLLHSFNFHKSGVNGFLFMFIGGFTGLALARKLNVEHGMQ